MTNKKGVKNGFVKNECREVYGPSSEQNDRIFRQKLGRKSKFKFY